MSECVCRNPTPHSAGQNPECILRLVKQRDEAEAKLKKWKRENCNHEWQVDNEGVAYEPCPWCWLTYEEAFNE